MAVIGRDAQAATDFAAIRRAIAFAYGTGYSAGEAEAAVTRLHDNYLGAAERERGLCRQILDADAGDWDRTIPLLAQIAEARLRELDEASTRHPHEPEINEVPLS